jgi:hypothetical protein
VAVGRYYDNQSGDEGPWVESQSAGVWSSGPLSLPGGATSTNAALTGVSCGSAGNCVAVGFYVDSSNVRHAVIETETSGVWSASAAPLTGLGSVVASDLTAVSCSAAQSCTAVGWYQTSSSGGALIETDSGGSWSDRAAPSPGSGSGLSLTSVACSASSDCVAVGGYSSGGSSQGLLETESGGSWTGSTPGTAHLGAASNPNMSLNSVSCPSAGNCTAAGTYEDSATHTQVVLVNQSGGTWQQASEGQLPSNVYAGGFDIQLNAVSCAAAGDCTAVGSYDATTYNNVEDVAFSEVGGSWSRGTEPSLPGDHGAAPEASLDAIACVAAGDCVATGTYETSGGANAALVLQQVNGSWVSPAGIPQATSYESYTQGYNWASAACSPDGYCATVGYTQDNSSNHQIPFELAAPRAPLAATATPSGTQATAGWSAPADDGGLPVSGYSVSAVDLTDAAHGGQTVTAAATATSATLTGLTPGDSYLLHVSALSPLGAGIAAATGQFTIAPGTETTQTTTTTTSTTTSTTATTTTTPTPTTTTTTTSGVTANGPTRAQIYDSLRVLLAPRGSSARLPHLRRARGYTFAYSALEAGRVTVRWYAVSGRGRHRRRLLAGSGAATAHHAGRIRLTVDLTGRGLRLVRTERQVKLIVVAGFVGGGLRVTRVHGFTLR